MKALAIAICCITLIADTVRAQLVETYSFDNLNETIPDNVLSGTTDSHTISSAIADIQSITLTLNISGLSAQEPAFNGDLYVYVTHSGNTAVLLNRTGRTGADSLGYADNGFNVTFSDSAVNGDIHQYRLTLFGNQNTPVDPNYVNPLTGTWAPDGRAVSPTSVLDTDPRTSLLNIFNGLRASGDWSLFLADLSPGGTAQLNSWSLEITAIPEPQNSAMILSLGCVLFTAGLQFARKHGTRAWVRW